MSERLRMSRRDVLNGLIVGGGYLLVKSKIEERKVLDEYAADYYAGVTSGEKTFRERKWRYLKALVGQAIGSTLMLPFIYRLMIEDDDVVKRNDS